jgi:DNA-binding MarR family transcriptional regulator
MNKSDSPWTFFTNHTHVLLCLARQKKISLRQVSIEVGITERSVQKIIADLESAGAITRQKVGRQNQYQINLDVTLRHHLEFPHTIGEVLSPFLGQDKK